jgi:hypothetical protein
MQQSTTKQLYAYWDRVRNGRLAPRRFEIEPASIAPLLPETFIAECTGFFSYRFRLVGTHVCDHFGRELRGTDFLSLWDAQDRDAMATAVTTVVRDGAAAHGTFHAYTATDRQATFEFVILPLVHAADSVNRLLGSIAAIEPPFWLGTEPLRRLELVTVDLHWPDGAPAFVGAAATSSGAAAARVLRERFRVYDGGLAKSD